MIKEKVQIYSEALDTEEILPYCPASVYDYLYRNYNLNAVMSHNFKNNDMHIGYIMGVMDVINHIKILAKINEE